jgi:hypothetical protein
LSNPHPLNPEDPTADSLGHDELMTPLPGHFLTGKPFFEATGACKTTGMKAVTSLPVSESDFTPYPIGIKALLIRPAGREV